jgi:hypothetical protein
VRAGASGVARTRVRLAATDEPAKAERDGGAKQQPQSLLNCGRGRVTFFERAHDDGVSLQEINEQRCETDNRGEYATVDLERPNELKNLRNRLKPSMFYESIRSAAAAARRDLTLPHE